MLTQTHSTGKRSVIWWILAIGSLLGIVLLTLSIPSPKDFTPPSIGISYPDAGATISGMVDIGIYAHDPSGIARVEISRNCRDTIAIFTRPPYTAVWDTAPLAVKNYTICVTAWDNAGLSSRAMREVTVVRK